MGCQPVLTLGTCLPGLKGQPGWQLEFEINIGTDIEGHGRGIQTCMDNFRSICDYRIQLGLGNLHGSRLPFSRKRELGFPADIGLIGFDIE